MSEELIITSDEQDKAQDIKKKNITKRKELDLTESYKYVPLENEKLIMDKPSEPLNKKDSNIMKSDIKPVKSNKELYESFVKELINFSLSVNNEIIYDSSIDKSKETPLKFENDFFILYGKKYSYNGLKIQKINKK